MNRLTVALFASMDADFVSVLQPYLDGANAMLTPYSMAIEVFTTDGTNTTPRKLSYTGAVFDGPGDPGKLRQLAHAALPVGRGIPVIFCKRNTDDAKGSGYEYGSTIQTKSEANNGVGWPPYVLINTQLKSASNEVLLHELIHAAYGTEQPKPSHDTDKSSAFYDYGNNEEGKGGNATRKLPQKHAEALRKAYFSTFVP